MRAPARRSAFVRAVGAVTPLGATWAETASALLEGASAVAPVAHFDSRGFPSRVAACIRGEDAPPGTAEAEDRRMPLALAAADEAWSAAATEAEPERIGIFLGAESGRPRFETIVALARAAAREGRFDAAAFGRAGPLVARGSLVSPAAIASRLAARVGALGPVMTVSLACASSAAALVEAVRAMRLGACDVALCGGVGADVDPLMLAGFGLLGALSEKGRSCPFDLRRDGFVLGEAAAMLVLSCERQGALCELRGIGRTLDAHHLTAPDPGGEGAARAMRLALEDAGIASVDYVQAHGTSTPLNDAVEAAAIRRVLGPRLAEARVSSVKGALGHTIAAAGALGLLCAVEAVAAGKLVPTAGLSEVDPDCELPHVMGRGLTRKVEAALANAFSFGGANCSLLVARA